MGFIIAGLGNPGTKYATNRHNIGFMCVDYLAESCQVNWSRSKWDGSIAQTRQWGERIWFVKPETYMNRSGRTIAGVSRYYDVDPERILVIHDDLDMHLGRVKLVRSGGTGGHNGIRSAVEWLGTNDFFRLKIGIGRPGNDEVNPEIPVDKYVLSDFTKEELPLIKERVAVLEDGIALLVKGDPKTAQSILNCLK